MATRPVGPAGLAVGVDLAEPMAAVAAGKLRQLGQGRGAVAVMDAERLGLRAGWFDVVCCASAIYLLDDQAAAVRGWRSFCGREGRWRSRSSVIWTRRGGLVGPAVGAWGAATAGADAAKPMGYCTGGRKPYTP